VLLAGTVTKGDCLGYSSGWQRSLGTTGGVIPFRAVAAEDGVSGQVIKVYFGETVVGGRFSGATAGGALYVAEGTSNGQYTQTLPSTSGDLTSVAGYMVTATIAHLLPGFNQDTAA